HQATALHSARRMAVASAARVARRSSLACSALMLTGSRSGRRAQAEGRQLLEAAAVLDQTRLVQRQAAAGLLLDDGLQAQGVDLAVGADGFLQFLRCHAVVFVREVDGSGGEVDTEG